MKQIFIVLFIILQIANSQTPPEQRIFNFNATIECSYLKPWCVQLDYFECDFLSPNDDIGASLWKCSDQPEQVIETYKVEERAGPFDGIYKLFVQVNHTCSEDGKIIVFNHVLPSVPAEKANKRINYKITL